MSLKRSSKRSIITKQECKNEEKQNNNLDVLDYELLYLKDTGEEIEDESDIGDQDHAEDAENEQEDGESVEDDELYEESSQDQSNTTEQYEKSKVYIKKSSKTASKNQSQSNSFHKKKVPVSKNKSLSLSEEPLLIPRITLEEEFQIEIAKIFLQKGPDEPIIQIMYELPSSLVPFLKKDYKIFKYYLFRSIIKGIYCIPVLLLRVFHQKVSTFYRLHQWKGSFIKYGWMPKQAKATYLRLIGHANGIRPSTFQRQQLLDIHKLIFDKQHEKVAINLQRKGLNIQRKKHYQQIIRRKKNIVQIDNQIKKIDLKIVAQAYLQCKKQSELWMRVRKFYPELKLAFWDVSVLMTQIISEGFQKAFRTVEENYNEDSSFLTLVKSQFEKRRKKKFNMSMKSKLILVEAFLADESTGLDDHKFIDRLLQAFKMMFPAQKRSQLLPRAQFD